MASPAQPGTTNEGAFPALLHISATHTLSCICLGNAWICLGKILDYPLQVNDLQPYDRLLNLMSWECINRESPFHLIVIQSRTWDPGRALHKAAVTFACGLGRAARQVSSYLVPCIFLISPKVSGGAEHTEIKGNVMASKHAFARGQRAGEEALRLKHP